MGQTLENRTQPSANKIQNHWVRDTVASWPPANR